MHKRSFKVSVFFRFFPELPVLIFLLSNCILFEPRTPTGISRKKYSLIQGIKNYGADRSRDFGDILNIGVERNTYGVRSFFLFGLPCIQDSTEGEGYGLVFGNFGKYKTGDADYPVTWTNINPFTYDMETDETFFGKNDLLNQTLYYSLTLRLRLQVGRFWQERLPAA